MNDVSVGANLICIATRGTLDVVDHEHRTIGCDAARGGECNDCGHRSGETIDAGGVSCGVTLEGGDDCVPIGHASTIAIDGDGDCGVSGDGLHLLDECARGNPEGSNGVVEIKLGHVAQFARVKSARGIHRQDAKAPSCEDYDAGAGAGIASPANTSPKVMGTPAATAASSTFLRRAMARLMIRSSSASGSIPTRRPTVSLLM